MKEREQERRINTNTATALLTVYRLCCVVSSGGVCVFGSKLVVHCLLHCLSEFEIPSF